MTVHTPRISVKPGMTVVFDGQPYDIKERSDGADDRFVVESHGNESVRHMDWFHDIVSDADRVVLERDRDD